MDYSIYKDDNVNSTVERIHKILKDVGIILNETFSEYPSSLNHIPGYNNYPTACTYIPYSSRVTLFNLNDVGANGKGTTKENSRASAHSEFIERLQNQALSFKFLNLSSNKFFVAPDEKEFDETTERFLSKYNYKKVFSALFPREINNIPFKRVAVPYFNVKDKKIHNLHLTYLAYTSNGMSAGNTPEEAIVQGLSEICERYAHKLVISDMVSMPDIPKKYYEKYERLKGMIDYTEQLGWKVYIKDASMGLGLPVVCAVFENKKEGVFSYRFGAQPSLPIAIERSITEFFQGGIQKDSFLKNEIFHIKDYSDKGRKYTHPLLDVSKMFFDNSEKIYSIFINKNADYKFSASSWVDDNKKYTNKELLKFIIDKITKATDEDIFIRDVSFLGFPSYHIFIPGLSNTVYYNDEKLNFLKWQLSPEFAEDPDDNVDSLISALLFQLKYIPMTRTIAPFIPDEYLLILCYILKNDFENILKYCNILKTLKEPDFVPRFVSENLNIINLIYQYFKLKQQKEPKNVIKNIINNMYDKRIIEEFYNLINNLNFEYIKNIISEAKNFDNKQYKENSKIDTNIENRIKCIEQNLIQKYIENTPDQMELAKVFDFSQNNILSN